MVIRVPWKPRRHAEHRNPNYPGRHIEARRRLDGRFDEVAPTVKQVARTITIVCLLLALGFGLAALIGWPAPGWW